MLSYPISYTVLAQTITSMCTHRDAHVTTDPVLVQKPILK